MHAAPEESALVWVKILTNGNAGSAPALHSKKLSGFRSGTSSTKPAESQVMKKI